MKRHSLSRSQWFFSVAVSIAFSNLAGCGGSSSAPSVTPYAYIVSADAEGQSVPGAVYQYSIAGDGSLAPLSPASVPTGVTPSAAAADPTGHYLYVANSRSDTISQYTVGAGGALMALSPATVTVGGPFPRAGLSLSVEPQGRFLYVVVSPQDPPGPVAAIAQYSIGSAGSLTPLSPAFVNVSAAASGALAFDANGHACLAGNDNAGGLVAQFSIDSDGALSPLEPASVFATAQAIGVAIAPGGRTAYVLSTCVDAVCDGQVALYTIGPDGTLAATTVSTLTGSHVNPVAMLLNDTGSSGYVLNNFMGIDTNSGAVYQYAIDNSGALTPYVPSSLDVASGSVAESTYGSTLYALSATAVGSSIGGPGGNVDEYAIGSDGQLTAVSTTSLSGGRPTAMVVVTP